MTWDEIKKAVEVRGEKLAAMKALDKKAVDEQRDLDEAEQKQFDDLRAEADALTKNIDRARQLNELDAAYRAQNAGGHPGRQPINDPNIDPERPLSEQRQVDGFAVKDLKRYSLLRALAKRAANEPLDGVEAEVSQELAKRAGRTPEGFFFPTDIPTGPDLQRSEQRATVNLTTGAGAIATILDVSNFIDALRNKLVCQKMGARVITGLVGNLALPKRTGVTTTYWVADETSPTASNTTVGQVSFSPETIGTYVDISRKFLLQSSLSAEAFVRDDLAKQMALGVDLGALNGSGTGNEPTGILQNSGVSTVAIGTNGGVPTWANIVAMETAIAALNADFGELGYVTNAKVRGLLKTTLKNNVAGARYMWEETLPDGSGMVNGNITRITNAIPSNLTKGTGTGLSAAIYGNWSDLVFGFWGMIDMLVDPYTSSNTGTVRIRALQDCNVALRHDESFAICTDIEA